MQKYTSPLTSPDRANNLLSYGQQGRVLTESAPAGSHKETIYRGTSKCIQRLEMMKSHYKL